MKVSDGLEAQPHGSGKCIVSDPIVVSSVSGSADELYNSMVCEAPGIGGDARLADLELVGDFVQGERLVGNEEESEDTPGDSGESVGLELQSEAFDVSVL